MYRFTLSIVLRKKCFPMAHFFETINYIRLKEI